MNQETEQIKYQQYTGRQSRIYNMITLKILHVHKGVVTITLPPDSEIKVTKDKVTFKGPETGTLQEWTCDIFTTVTVTY